MFFREFKLAEDMFAQDSIELLKLSGINFVENESRGIDVQCFGELLMSSGIVLNEDVRAFSGLLIVNYSNIIFLRCSNF